MSHDARQTGPALETMYRFTLWLIPTLEKFPRSQRFLLGDRIETAALDVLDLLIQATDTRERLLLLRRANLGLERLRILARPPACACGLGQRRRPPVRTIPQRQWFWRARRFDRTIGFASLYPSYGLGPS